MPSRPRKQLSHFRTSPPTRSIFGLLARVAVATALLAAAPAAAQLKQTFYVPIAEEEVRQIAIDINTSNSGNTTAPNPDTTRAVVSISATANSTVVYYDHWEDGYEADLANPVQASTEVFNLNA
ncbi:MAG: hypothetical protein MI919_33335, partial [Holophagales bacterium]|nr:hypothetical protein [Holophagales bacterium]